MPVVELSGLLPVSYLLGDDRMNSPGVMQSRWAPGASARDTESALPASARPGVEEQALIARCQRGDEAAFRELHRRYRARAVYLATQLLRDRDEAEDVVQEAFLRAFRSIRKFRGEASFYSWLYRIVVNLCRGRSRRAAAHPTVPLDETRAADHPGDWGATRLYVEALLGRLSEGLRVTLLLREMAGLSYAEIAEELEMPVGTVRSRLSAAREQLRRMWEESDQR
jgi:RNA polymerase sigma-70 factor, ECF subfamily